MSTMEDGEYFGNRFSRDIWIDVLVYGQPAHDLIEVSN
jgi:hypothetical protein